MTTRSFWVVLSTLLLSGGFIALVSSSPQHPILQLRSRILPAATQGIPPLTLGTPTAAPSVITINSSTPVTVSVQIPDPNVIPGSVNLLRVSPAGNQSTIVGLMDDDGKNGDLMAADKLFTLTLPLVATTSDPIILQASAALRGRLQRINSPPVTIDNVRHYSDGALGVRGVMFPAVLTPVSTGPTSISFQPSNNQFIPSGGKLPEGIDPSRVTVDGYSVTISRQMLNRPFSLPVWLSQNRPYSIVSSSETIMVDQQVSYRITFSDELQAGKPTTLVPKGGSLYVISYRSSYSDGSKEETVGRQGYDLVLASVTFQ